MNRTKIKNLGYMILGSILTLAIVITVPQVSALVEKKTATVTYNDIQVNIDGVAVKLTDLQGNEIEPVMMFDTLYVPMSPMARAFGYSSTYEGSSRTVFIKKSSEPPTRTASFLAVAPAYETSRYGEAGAYTEDSAMMGGTEYGDAMWYRGHNLGNKDYTVTHYSLHNLNKRYTKITGYIGRIDGKSLIGATFNFYGNGELLASHELTVNDIPKQISLNVKDVGQFKIEIVYEFNGEYASPAYAFAGATIE